MTRLIDRPRNPSWASWRAHFGAWEPAARRLIVESPQTVTIDGMQVRPVRYGPYLDGPDGERANVGAALTLDTDDLLRWAAVRHVNRTRGGGTWHLEVIIRCDDLTATVARCRTLGRELISDGFKILGADADPAPPQDGVIEFLRSQVQMLDELDD